jgi:putative copper resistance protein D
LNHLNPLWDLLFAALILSTALWYISEHRARKSVSLVRQSSFLIGLLLAFILLVGPVPHAAIRTFWIHMIQHIGLMMLISPLLVLGAPITVAVNSERAWVRALTHSVGSNRLLRQLFKPQVGFGIFLAVLITTHFSPLANLGMTNPNAHCGELLLFLLGGFIYYYPVMEGNPHPYFVPYSLRVISLFAMMLPETMVGFFLYSGNRVLHSLPQQTSMQMGLTDQHRGGAIMWAMGMLIDTLWIVLAAKDWFANEQLLAEEDDESEALA